MTPHHHIPGYLHRWRLFGLGRLMVRLHRILDVDRTPFVHTHPFSYVSVVLRGGYSEAYEAADGTLVARHHRPGAVIVRGHDIAHRITAVQPGCLTLFFAWSRPGRPAWRLLCHADATAAPDYWHALDGLYRTPTGYRRRWAGRWYAERATATQAWQCNVLSIHQHHQHGSFIRISRDIKTPAAVIG